MAVNLTAKTAEQLPPVEGVQLYTAKAGIKQPGRDDLPLMVLSPGVSAAPDRASTRWSWEDTSFHSQATRAAMRARTTTMAMTVQRRIRRQLGRGRFGSRDCSGSNVGLPGAGSSGDW